MSKLNNTLEYVCERAKKPETFIEECENRYNSIIGKIAEETAKQAFRKLL